MMNKKKKDLKKDAKKAKKELEKNAEKAKQDVKDSAHDIKEKGYTGYQNTIDRLDQERKNLQHELDRNYKEGRRYVRSNPEEGVLLGLIGGITLGLILGGWIKK